MTNYDPTAGFYLNEHQQVSRERAMALLEQCKKRDKGKHLVLVSHKPKTYKLVSDKSAVPVATKAQDEYAQPRSFKAQKERYEEIAVYFRNLCNEHSLSFSELARRIKINPGLLSRAASGKARIMPNTAKLLAEYFNVDESNFL